MIQAQRGIGLIEVLVALLLLAIAVLGFSAMQLTALKATDESVMRSRAITMMRGASEMMRANPTGIAKFGEALNSSVSPSSLTVDGAAINKDSCVVTSNTSTSSCTIQQLATRDGLALKQYAADNEIQIKLEGCPATSSGTPLSCLIAAWGDTTATLGTGANHCLNATTGIYNKGATCFVLEAY
nr:type IV pilus modification protein PilV [Moraxella osloensis]